MPFFFLLPFAICSLCVLQVTCSEDSYSVGVMGTGRGCGLLGSEGWEYVRGNPGKGGFNGSVWRGEDRMANGLI